MRSYLRTSPGMTQNANVIGRNVARFRYQKGWSQDLLVTKMQLLGFISLATSWLIPQPLAVTSISRLADRLAFARLPLKWLIGISSTRSNASVPSATPQGCCR